MRFASRGSRFAHFQASALWEWPATESASHTFRSGKNEVMRIVIFRKRRAKLPRALNEWPGEIFAAFVRVGVGLLDRPHDQRTDGRPGLLRPAPQPVVQWFGNVNCSADRHDMIMS